MGSGSIGHRIGKAVIKTGDIILNIIIAVIIIVLLLYGTFSIWDNYRIVHNADPEQFAKFSPEKDPLTFLDFAKTNKDVVGWLTIPNTGIDYPLVQGDETYYLNHDAMGDYSLTGSLFLSSNNSPDFSDFNTIVYGHHMVSDKMFGDIDKFLDQSFFESNPEAKIYYDSSRNINEGFSENGDWKWHTIKIAAIIECDGYDNNWYSPGMTDEGKKQSFIERLKTDSLYYRELNLTTSDRLIEMSTCRSENTNGRTILIGEIT